MFRNILKGLKKEAEKIIEEVEEWEDEKEEEYGHEETYQSVPAGRYGRLTAWIKYNYGDRFQRTSTIEEVKEQLEKILNERERMGDFRDNPSILKGFKSYIDKQEYGDLIKVK